MKRIFISEGKRGGAAGRAGEALPKGFLRGQADRIVVQLMREKSGADEIHRA